VAVRALQLGRGAGAVLLHGRPRRAAVAAHHLQAAAAGRRRRHSRTKWCTAACGGRSGGICLSIGGFRRIHRARGGRRGRGRSVGAGPHPTAWHADGGRRRWGDDVGVDVLLGLPGLSGTVGIVCLSIVWAVRLRSCPIVWPSVCLSVCLPVCLSVYLSVILPCCASDCVAVVLSVCLRSCPVVHPTLALPLPVLWQQYNWHHYKVAMEYKLACMAIEIQVGIVTVYSDIACDGGHDGARGLLTGEAQPVSRERRGCGRAAVRFLGGVRWLPGLRTEGRVWRRQCARVSPAGRCALPCRQVHSRRLLTPSIPCLWRRMCLSRRRDACCQSRPSCVNVGKTHLDSWTPRASGRLVGQKVLPFAKTSFWALPFVKSHFLGLAEGSAIFEKPLFGCNRGFCHLQKATF
jgi:hypothetical protein